jgi:hypothetical protein
MANDHLIQDLVEQLQIHRQAAMDRNEPPGGYNRSQAENLQVRINRLQQKHETRRQPTHLPYKALLVLFYAAFIAWAAEVYDVKGWLNKHTRVKTHSLKQKPATASQPTIESKPAISRVPDPALAMQERFYGSKLEGTYAALDSGFSNYQRLSGTLARIQAVALLRRSAAQDLPSVWINRTREDCFDRRSIGIYSPKCQVIKVDYSDGYTTYEHPMEMEVTLAHEWGHHLIALSGITVSPTEQEVVSDCFAGVAFGYYALNNLATIDDSLKAANMISRIGNNGAHGYHPNSETRLRSFTGGLFSVASPNDPRAPEFMASCPSLHKIIDVSKIRLMGLSWTS